MYQLISFFMSNIDIKIGNSYLCFFNSVLLVLRFFRYFSLKFREKTMYFFCEWDKYSVYKFHTIILHQSYSLSPWKGTDQSQQNQRSYKTENLGKSIFKHKHFQKVSISKTHLFLLVNFLCNHLLWVYSGNSHAKLASSLEVDLLGKGQPQFYSI